MEYIIGLIIIVVVTLFFGLTEKGHRLDAAAKIAICIFAVIISAGIWGLYLAIANAEEAIVAVKGTKPVIADGKLQLVVYFDYQGEELSWYEEVEDSYFDTTCQYHVVIENNVEVVDAVKEQPSG